MFSKKNNNAKTIDIVSNKAKQMAILLNELRFFFHIFCQIQFVTPSHIFIFNWFGLVLVREFEIHPNLKRFSSSVFQFFEFCVYAAPKKATAPRRVLSCFDVRPNDRSFDVLELNHIPCDMFIVPYRIRVKRNALVSTFPNIHPFNHPTIHSLARSLLHHSSWRGRRWQR